MSSQNIEIIITIVLLLHGLGHGGAIVALVVGSRGTPTGKWLAARSWLFPRLSSRLALTIAIIFWSLSLIGFVIAALWNQGFLYSAGIMQFLAPITAAIQTGVWGSIALISSFVSFIGITLFWGTWPMFNTLAAQAVNLAVIITQLWLHWPRNGRVF
jgi:hypothetical protein